MAARPGRRRGARRGRPSPQSTFKRAILSPMRFPGVIPAVTTPFDASGRVDLDLRGRNARALLDAGMTGLAQGHTMGEAGSLSADERRTVIEALVDDAAGLFTVASAFS